MYDVRDYLHEFNNLLSENVLENWNSAIQLLRDSWTNNDSVFVAGNGGNHLNALHFGTDWNKGLIEATGKSLRTTVFGSNVGLFSAIENDGEHEFSIINYLTYSRINAKVFVLMSAGGTSKNILNAALFAKKAGIRSIGLLGGTNHSNSTLFDICLHVPSNDIQLVEDIHAIFGHSVLKGIISQTAFHP